MKAITLWQPWATWIAIGWKTIETRRHMRFTSLVGCRIAIQAAQKWDPQWVVTATPFLTEEQWATTSLARLNNKWPRGALVCTVVVDHMVRAVGRRDDWGKLAMCDVAGKICYFLSDIKPLPHPVPFKGWQGIFNVPDE